MIDIENQVFDKVAKALRAKYKGIYVNSEPLDVPPAFPAVTLYQRSTSAYERSQTAESRENHATVMYETDVYSNLSNGAKQQAKAIFADINTLMEQMGFIRTFGQPVDNFADTSIYRFKGRYKGVVSKDHIIYTS